MGPFLSKRTFGVEIEVFHFPYGFFLPIDSGVMPPYRLPDEMLHAFRDAGLALGRDENSWRFVEDHSIMGGRGVELQSPPLGGEEGIRQVENTLDILERFGAGVNGSCGFHVHHHARDFGARELANLVRLMATWEPRIYRAIPGNQGRVEKTCKPLSLELMRLLEKREYPSLESMEEAWYGDADPAHREVRYHDTRYHGLNLHSYWFRGTVEFRYMKGTLKGEVAGDWIVFTHAIMETAAGKEEGAMPLAEAFFERFKGSLSGAF